MKKLLLLFAALTCCFAMKAQSITYEPIMSIPSPINSDAVYYLGYQDGQDFYLHTSGTTAGEMQLSKNPENPLEYHIELFTNAVPNFVYARCGTNYLTITNDGVSAGGLSPFASSPYTLVIQDGDISSAAASGYTVCHDGNNIITTHTGTSEGNLRFFVKNISRSFLLLISSLHSSLLFFLSAISSNQLSLLISSCRWISDTVCRRLAFASSHSHTTMTRQPLLSRKV